MSSLLPLGAWLATYAVHSTVLLVAALAVSRFITNQSARDAIWKCALLGGFVTSLLPAMTGATPLVGRWGVVASERPVQADVALQATPSAATAKPSAPEISGTSSATVESNDTERRLAVRPNLPNLLITAWILGAILLILRLVFQNRRILRALRDRHRLADGSLPPMLAELRRKAAYWQPVRLSSSEACPTPIALGRSEICVPARFAVDLDIEQQRNALAHELAHLKRRDPLWQLGAGIIESVFFFQPLNVVARLKLREAAEYLCDDWAVEQTSSPLALARCLTQISSWVGSAPVPDGMLAMAEGGSPLVSRIERLAEWQSTSSAPARAAALVAVLFIAFVATSAPVFSAVAPAKSGIVASVIPADKPQSESPDSVVRYTGPSRSLGDRWAWALSQSIDRPHWIGWEIEAAPLNGTNSASSSTPHIPFPDKSAPTVASHVGAQLVQSHTGIFIRFDRGRAVESRMDGAAFFPMTSSVRLGGIWLGDATTSESLALIRRLMRSSRNPDMREELAAAFAIHSDANLVIPGVRALLESEGSSDVRSEAIQWLARMHPRDPRTVDVLRVASLTGRDSDSRVEAVDGLRTTLAHGNPRARAALTDVAANATDMRVRSEAMQTLSRSRAPDTP